MKNLILTCVYVCLVANVCSQNTDTYKKAIIDCVQIHNGVQTDLGVQISDLKEKAITVADSIKVLQEQYAKEKASRVETAEKSVAHYKDAISKQKAKGGLVAETMVKSLTPKLRNAQQELSEAEAWEPSYLQKYNNQAPHTILAKLVSCRLSLMNPRLNARQEGDASFLFTADGKRILRTVK